MQEISFLCSPEQATDDEYIRKRITSLLHIPSPRKLYFEWSKRSIDARKKKVKIRCSFKVYIDDEKRPGKYEPQYSDLKKGQTVHIIGLGPAGIFAALKALELGIKPIVYERGKPVSQRIQDIGKLNRKGVVNEESNYCFGEGGAGTYSDGKLYTRSKKRGAVREVLESFVYFGANKDILIDAHPHIGTNKLPQIVSKMSDEILKRGGEIHFEHKLTDISIDDQRITSIEINKSEHVSIERLILATGHSARDVFEILHKRGIKVLPKPFALGVRVEHKQEFIDIAQYGKPSDEFLTPASYKLVTQIKEKGVYSFCMCPGGIIAPCATVPGEVVTNGWSPSKRNNPYANSGIVVSIHPEDLENPNDPFCGVHFQKSIERKAWELAGKSQKVPAQLLLDFMNKKKSTEFPRSSYQPGIESVEMDLVFPDFIISRLRKAFIDFDKKIPGFITNDAVIHAPESRTSSPILIPRDKEALHHVDVHNLFPCAEGAGYAGGIVSAAVDGMNCITRIAKQ